MASIPTESTPFLKQSLGERVNYTEIESADSKIVDGSGSTHAVPVSLPAEPTKAFLGLSMLSQQRTSFAALIIILLITAFMIVALALTTQKISDVPPESVYFSNKKWTVKTSSVLMGPGPNYFAAENVHVNASGYLTLSIRKQSDNVWTTGEIISQENFGYGTYEFVACSKLDRYDQNIVVGMFTWDDNSYVEQVNDEIDIEFARWGTTRDVSLQYSVQPTHNELYVERTNMPPQAVEYDSHDCSTHMFTWTPLYIKFEGHKGDSVSPKTLTHQWTFSNGSQPRAASQFTRSIRIPEPTANTKVHINFWLCDPNGDGIPEPPANQQNAHVIFKKFKFTAL